MRQGWECPDCEAVHAPHIGICTNFRPLLALVHAVLHHDMDAANTIVATADTNRLAIDLALALGVHLSGRNRCLPSSRPVSSPAARSLSGTSLMGGLVKRQGRLMGAENG
jgi:hypothetical protein